MGEAVILDQSRSVNLAESLDKQVSAIECFLNCRSRVRFTAGSPSQIKLNPIDNASRIVSRFHNVSRPFTNAVGESAGFLFSFFKPANPTSKFKFQSSEGVGTG